MMCIKFYHVCFGLSAASFYSMIAGAFTGMTEGGIAALLFSFAVHLIVGCMNYEK